MPQLPISLTALRRQLAALLLAAACLPAGGSALAAAPEPQEITLPSGAPSGVPRMDTIRVVFYPAETSEARAPAVVLLHPIGASSLGQMRYWATYLAERGISAAIMVLPGHMDRLPGGESPGERFMSPDVAEAVQMLRQSAADVSTVGDWLTQQPAVDPDRLGVAGASLGAIVTHLVMGKDERFGAGVAVLGGGNLVRLRRRSWIFKLHKGVGKLEPEEIALVREVEPLEYADRNRPRRVLMIQAARDIIVPPGNARQLWKALGRPPIRWIDTGHPAAALVPRRIARASYEYLDAVWQGKERPGRAVSPVRVPTVTAGMMIGLDSIVTPSVTYQAYNLAYRRDHMAALHADLGWTGRGPYLGLAATLNAYFDVGIGHRLHGDPVKPYATLHLTY